MSSYRVEAECLAKSFVGPQWLPGGRSFWYRQDLGEGASKFTLVDIAKKSVGPAFDHNKLSVELSKTSGKAVAADRLPFTWIEIENDLIRFRLDHQIWQYSGNNTLTKWNGGFTQADPALTYQVKPRPYSSHYRTVSVNFVNRTRKGLDLYTIDESCRARHFMYLARGQSWTQTTRSGKVWRFQEEGSEMQRGTYCVPDVAHDIVVIGDVNFDEYWGPENGFSGEITNSLPPGWEEHEDEQGRIYYLNTTNDTKTWSRPVACAPIKKEYEEEGVINTAPQPATFVSDDRNVWLRDGAGVETQLSYNANKDIRYDPAKIFPSPNNKFGVVWQRVDRDYSNMDYTINYSPNSQLQPKLIQRESAIPGARMKIFRPRLFDLVNKCEAETREDLFNNPYEVHDLGWSNDGTEYRFLYQERGHQCIRVLGMRTDGKVWSLLEEKSQTFIDTTKFYYRLLEKSDRMLWASERDGYNHIYLINLKTGQVESQVTKGKWNIYTVERLDEDKEELWIPTYGFWESQDPYHLHLIHVNFDGTDCRALTEGDGTHLWSWPFNQQEYFVDTWSRVDLPPQTVVRSIRTGDLQLEIKGESFESLKEKGWDPVERFATLGRDGHTLIYGIIIRPPNFKEGFKYPILEHIYSGPQTFFTPKKFGQGGEESSWAVEGRVVVIMDAMGTNWRSRKFLDVCYKNLNDGGFPDRILWIREAAKTRSWMDLSRIGILGVSAGGTSALTALLHYGDFYKVAVSDAGVHDQRIGPPFWNEQWLGYPVDESYIENSNITHVKNLRVMQS